MSSSPSTTTPNAPRATQWRVLIADDEPAARRGVRQLLSQFTDFVVAGECRDGEEVLKSLDVSRPDVVFLDVQMPGVDGFEVIRQRTPERMPLTVFLTAYDEFAIQAFEAQALDYLVKPVTEARFAATIRRLTRQLRATSTAREESIVVTTTRGAMIIPVREVEWIESADNYARVWTNGKGYLLRESMRALEDRIRDCGFVRVHRQALVRIGSIREVVASGDNDCAVVLSSGARIDVSRRRRAGLLEAVREGRAAR